MVQLGQEHYGYEYSNGEKCIMNIGFYVFLAMWYSWAKNILVWWGSLKFQGPVRSCDLTIDRWLVLFNQKCFHDLETGWVIVCIYNFSIINQDFSGEFCIMSYV